MAQSVLYGVMQERDTIAPTTPAVEIDRELLINATQITLVQHNAEIDQFGRLWSDDTTERQLKFLSYATNELQPGDEYTDPVPVKGAGSFNTYFPISQWYGAWGATFITSEQMTAQDVSDRVTQMLEGDANTYRKAILSALLKKEAYTSEDANGDITTSGLANGDAITYLDTTADAASVANHYGAQAAAIDDTHTPFPTMEANLDKRPRNAGPYVALISSNLKASIQALDGFVAVTTNAIIIAPAATTSTLNLPSGVTLPPSATVIGAIGKFVVAEYPRLPAGHILYGAVGAPKPLLRRQYPQSSLQGFRPIGTETDKFPFQKQRWFRAFGFGGYNRVGWGVWQVLGSGAYATPAAYDNPLGK